MIYYFTGTGNSEWVAKQLAIGTNDTAVNICKDDVNKEVTDKKVGIVFPIYAWGMPAPVEAFVKSLKLPADCYFYTVCTCGADCGVVDSQIESVSGKKLNAKMSVAMANNYIQGSNCSDEAEAKRFIQAAKVKLAKFITAVNAGEDYVDMTRGIAPHVLTKAIHPAFLKFASSDKKFYATDACIGCGLCESFCPLGNIKLVDKKPQWQGNCCQCTSCINRCPSEAIQYGKSTEGRIRYYFHDEYAN